MSIVLSSRAYDLEINLQLISNFTINAKILTTTNIAIDKQQLN